MKKSGFILFIAIILICSGCEVRRQNHDSDIERTEIRMKEYYDNLKAKNFDVLSQQFAPRFTQEEVLQQFEKLDTTYGDFIQYEIPEITTDITEKNESESGTSTVTAYCTYARHTSTEHFLIVWNGSETFIDQFMVTINE